MNKVVKIAVLAILGMLNVSVVAMEPDKENMGQRTKRKQPKQATYEAMDYEREVTPKHSKPTRYEAMDYDQAFAPTSPMIISPLRSSAQANGNLRGSQPHRMRAAHSRFQARLRSASDQSFDDIITANIEHFNQLISRGMSYEDAFDASIKKAIIRSMVSKELGLRDDLALDDYNKIWESLLFERQEAFHTKADGIIERNELRERANRLLGEYQRKHPEHAM